MYYNDVETQIWELKNIFTNKLNNEIEYIGRKYQDDRFLKLEKIKRIFIGEPSEPPLQDLPCVAITSERIIVNDRGLGGNTEDVSSIDIICYLGEDMNLKVREHYFFEILHMKIYRYVNAIRNVLMKNENRNINNTVHFLNITNIEVSPTIGINNIGLKWATITIETKGLRKYEGGE